MRLPASKSVASKRLVDNALRFSGNHIWIWMLIMLMTGIFLNRWIVAAAITISAGWFIAQIMYRESCLAQAGDGRLATNAWRETETSLPPLSKAWLLLFTAFILYEFSVLSKVLLTLMGTMVIVASHSVLRPVVNEYYFVHQPQPQTKRPSVVHSDGFEDSSGEDEVAFSKDENSDPNILRNRNASKSL
eukprot:scaffold3701_cov192-Alexandrium_tamarense.AAC.18